MCSCYMYDIGLGISCNFIISLSFAYTTKDLLGLVKLASINNSITKTSYYFLGAVDKWRYIMAKDFPGKETKND